MKKLQNRQTSAKEVSFETKDHNPANFSRQFLHGKSASEGISSRLQKDHQQSPPVANNYRELSGNLSYLNQEELQAAQYLANKDYSAKVLALKSTDCSESSGPQRIKPVYNRNNFSNDSQVINEPKKSEQLEPDAHQQDLTENIFHKDETTQRSNDSPKFADIPDSNSKTKARRSSHKNERNQPQKKNQLVTNRQIAVNNLKRNSTTPSARYSEEPRELLIKPEKEAETWNEAEESPQSRIQPAEHDGCGSKKQKEIQNIDNLKLTKTHNSKSHGALVLAKNPNHQNSTKAAKKLQSEPRGLPKNEESPEDGKELKNPTHTSSYEEDSLEAEYPLKSLVDKLNSSYATFGQKSYNTRNDYLFQRALIQQETRKLIQEKAKALKEKSLMKDCSFHPHINSDYSVSK